MDSNIDKLYLEFHPNNITITRQNSHSGVAMLTMTLTLLFIIWHLHYRSGILTTPSREHQAKVLYLCIILVWDIVQTWSSHIHTRDKTITWWAKRNLPLYKSLGGGGLAIYCLITLPSQNDTDVYTQSHSLTPPHSHTHRVTPTFSHTVIHTHTQSHTESHMHTVTHTELNK